MKKSIGNPFHEAHGKDMVVYEWIAPLGTNPYDIPGKIQAIVPELKVVVVGNEQNGFVNTSLQPDGCLYVAVALHQEECLDDNCNKGEGKIKIMKAPILDKTVARAMRDAIKEHPTKKVEGDNDE